MEKQLKHEDPLDALILDFLDAKKGNGKMKKKKKMTENKRLDIEMYPLYWTPSKEGTFHHKSGPSLFI